MFWTILFFLKNAVLIYLGGNHFITINEQLPF
eukprot:UN14025